MNILSKDDIECYYRCRQQFAASTFGTWIEASAKESRLNFEAWLATFGAKIDKSSRNSEQMVVVDYMGFSANIDKIVFNTPKDHVMFKLKFSSKS